MAIVWSNKAGASGLNSSSDLSKTGQDVVNKAVLKKAQKRIPKATTAPKTKEGFEAATRNKKAKGSGDVQVIRPIQL